MEADHPIVSVEELATLKEKEEMARELVRQLTALHHNISITRSKIEEHEKALQKSYIAVLPYDILILIFTDHVVDGSSHQSGYPPLLTLSHVCRRWREMTIHTPALWAGLSIGSEIIANQVGYSRQIIELFLERAQDCALEIWFAEGQDRSDPEAINILVSCMERCRVLRATLQPTLAENNSGDSPHDFIVRFANISAPRLEKLVLGRVYWSHPQPPSAHILRGGAPRLSSLRLYWILPTLLEIGGGLSALTSLDVAFPYGLLLHQTLLGILSGAPLLKTLRLDSYSPSPYELEHISAPVELNYLTSLEATTDALAYDVLSMIKVPLLHDLVLSQLCLLRLGGVRKFRNFVQHHTAAFPLLQTLSIALCEHSACHAELPRLSNVFPNIIHLKAGGHWGEYGQRFLKMLGREAGWPSLKLLTVVNPPGELDDLIECIKERKAAGHKLRKVIVEGRPVSERWLHDWFKEASDDIRELITFSEVVDMKILSVVGS